MRSRALLPIAVLVLAAAALAPSAGATSLKRLMAPADACPGATELDAPVRAQEQAMLCLTDFAREQRGLGRLSDDRELDRSAGRKSHDILRCDSFSHFACGHEFTYWMRRAGYLRSSCWRVGENIAWGVGEYGSVRSIFNAWLHSPEHRANILGRYVQSGVGLRVGGLDGRPDAHVWVQHFGSHCGRGRPETPERHLRHDLARSVAVG